MAEEPSTCERKRTWDMTPISHESLGPDIILGGGTPAFPQKQDHLDNLGK